MSSPSQDTAGRADGSARAQLSVTVVLMLVGVGMVIGGIDYGIGSLSSPGTGFVPCLVGLALVGFGAVLLIQDLRGSDPADDLFGDDELAEIAAIDVPQETADDPADKSARARLSTPLAVLACMVCFAFIMFASEALGLLVTASIVVAVLAYIMRTSWWASILLGIGFYAASYVIFAMWLAIPLPFGTITTG